MALRAAPPFREGSVDRLARHVPLHELPRLRPAQHGTDLLAHPPGGGRLPVPQVVLEEHPEHVIPADRFHAHRSERGEDIAIECPFPSPRVPVAPPVRPALRKRPLRRFRKRGDGPAAALGDWVLAFPEGAAVLEGDHAGLGQRRQFEGSDGDVAADPVDGTRRSARQRTRELRFAPVLPVGGRSAGRFPDGAQTQLTPRTRSFPGQGPVRTPLDGVDSGRRSQARNAG